MEKSDANDICSLNMGACREHEIQAGYRNAGEMSELVLLILRKAVSFYLISL